MSAYRPVRTRLRCSRISANPGDVLLTVAANPESGFPVAAGTSIPASQIQMQGKQGSSGSLTVPVTVNFDAPLVVSSAQSNALDLEFDLANPAFIIGHTPPAAAGATLWAVNFDGPRPPPRGARHRAPGAASYLWHRDRRRRRQPVIHDEQGLPGAAGHQPGDRGGQLAEPADPGRQRQRHDLLRRGRQDPQRWSRTSRRRRRA